eukprot:5946919-Prymnesium_polylepis.1
MVRCSFRRFTCRAVGPGRARRESARETFAALPSLGRGGLALTPGSLSLTTPPWLQYRKHHRMPLRSPAQSGVVERVLAADGCDYVTGNGRYGGQRSATPPRTQSNGRQCWRPPHRGRPPLRPTQPPRALAAALRGLLVD